MNSELINVFIQIPTYIFWKDLHSTFMGCNHHFAEAAGIASSELIPGKTDFDLAWGETHGELYRQGDQEVLEGNVKEHFIEPQRQADGNIINILINKVPLLNKEGQKIGIIGSYMEMKQTQYHGVIDPNKKNISLTNKQIDCLAYLAKGWSAKQIASELIISRRTVESHIEALKTKLNLTTKAQLVKKAWSIDFIKARILQLS